MTLPLLPHQVEAVARITARGGSGGLFMDMGTGKTRAAIQICRQLGLKRVLVVAPSFVMGVWVNQLEKWWPRAHFVVLDQGDATARAEACTKAMHIVASNPNAPMVVITNYEGYWRQPLRKVLVKSFDPQMAIYDEAHRLKGRGTKQSRFAHNLANTVPHRLGLTGTPMESGPQDLYSLFKAVDPTVFGTRWDDFKEQYIKVAAHNPHVITGYRNMAHLERLLGEASYRITKEEALDLPPQVDVELPVTLASRRVYEELKQRAIAEIEGLRGEEGIALSRCVLTNLLRLQQVANGFVKVTDGRIVELSTEKYDALADLLTDAVPSAGRVVVFCRFRHDVTAAVRAAFPVVGSDAMAITGDVSPSQRAEILKRFAETERAVLVLQIAVGSLGIDLSMAHMAVFYSPDYSMVNYLQARDRLHRLGQEHKVTYYHMVARDTVDEAIYDALASKRSLTSGILTKAAAVKIFT